MNPSNLPNTPPPIPGSSGKEAGKQGLTYTQARNYMLVNQFATPGLGSLLAKRWLAGGLQLALAVIGFALVVIWFGKIMADLWRLAQSDQPAEPISHAVWGWAGLAFMGAAWCWSLMTSLSLMKEARANEARIRGY